MTYPSCVVVIPCWNAEKWIARSIRSTLEQGYPNLEIIVIDDGSTDNSLSVIRSFGDRIRWETGPNCGAAAARNRGLALTKADYVVFLDADDWLEDRYLTNALYRASSKPDLILTSFVLEEVTSKRKHFAFPPQSPGGLPLLKEWLVGPNPCTSSMIFARQFISSIGGWREDLRVQDDFELGLRALAATPKIEKAPDAIAIYFQPDSSCRVSLRTDSASWCTFLDLLDSHAAWIRSYRCREVCHAYGVWYYRTARKLYQAGDACNGGRALRSAREFGVSGHIGPLKDRLLSTILGLRLREEAGRVKRALRSWRQNTS